MGWQEIVIDIVRQNWSKLRPVPIPKETFRIVEDHTYPAWWHMGKQNDQPATQISARYFVTNIALGKALITGCKLNLVGSDEAYHLRHLVRQMKFKDEDMPTRLVSVDGFIEPPITKDGEPLEAQIFFIDQFGNENPGPVTTFRPE